MRFLNNDYLLGNESGKKIFEQIENIPIVDPHNHADVAELATNRNYNNPWQFLIGTDHYIWALMRKFSIDEFYITGSALPEEKWLKLAEVFPCMAGNPVYEWMHLELKRFLGIDQLLGPKTGKEIWEQTSSLLKSPEYRPQQLLDKLGVEVMCSSDDPLDFLDFHQKVNKDMGRSVVVPTWRADRIVKVSSPDWRGYVKKLAERFESRCSSVQDLIDILRKSHDYFAEYGCKASDHSMRTPFPCVAEVKQADKIFKALLNEEQVSTEDKEILADYIFANLAEMDSEKNWVFQMHIGVVRDVRSSLFSSFGPDAGCDVSDHFVDMIPPMETFLNRFDNRLKVILYCLDFAYQSTFATIARSFGQNVKLGAAWWFCDTPFGMKRQFEYISSVDLLYSFAGMVSDSRRILAYGSRFEMFRRVLSDVLGDMVEKGSLPENISLNLAKRICYSGPKEFFEI
ncbi:glucuronate isomerase [bacterium]|nr:glucuronate isomerase [bacterium]